MEAINLKKGVDEYEIEDQIDKLNDFLAAVELGKKFEPKVIMKGIREIEKAQQRLRLALQKVRGDMKDYGAMGDALTGMRQGDHASRIKLIELIKELQRQLNQIDDTLLKQLKFEEATRTAVSESEKHKKSLQNEKSIIVVAGEVSSGKSTLVNLMLGKDNILPAKRLSCTFTACELVYGTTEKAWIVFDDGREETKPFEERGQYIYKPTSRDQQFKHRGVRLSLPISMLQSGLTLVDTPGVGERSTTERIVFDYVERNDVFGFIFTINAFDSGGVRLQFKTLLHQLCTIEDANKHRKLNPSSVIFVVNFWDKVPDKEKEDTRKQIEYDLQKLPFMGTFNPAEQIFFMDSQEAMESLKLDAKLITDDFRRLIDGIRKYFPVEQKLKLEESYSWMQNLFERLLHPVKTFLVKQRPPDRTKEITEKIEEVQSQYKISIIEAHNKYNNACKELSTKLFKSLQKQHQKVLTWKSKEIPSQQPGESWSAFEERLDKAIDDRISQVIVDVEEEHAFISKAYEALTNYVSVLINDILNQLSDIERELRNSVPRGLKRRGNSIEKRSQHPNIVVTVGREHGAELIVPTFTAKSMFERVWYGPTLAIFGPTQHQQRQAIKQEMEKFHSDPPHCMSIRAEIIYKHFCTTEYINQFSEQELQKIKEYIEKNEVAIPEQIESNNALLHGKYVNQIAKDAKPNDSMYRVFLEEIQKLYDELLLLGRESIVPDTFKQDDITLSMNKAKKANFLDASMPQHFSKAILKDSEKVTLLKFNMSPSCVLRYRETDRFYHQEYLRMTLKPQSKNERRHSMAPKYEKAPKLLGTYDSGQTLVFEGHLIIARCFTGDESIWHGQIDKVMTFLRDLGRALNEIHLKKMAHCILSLDTLLLDDKEGFTVRLTNLFELATIQINESEDIITGQLLYLAPEILFGDQKLYTPAADVYALGLIMIELWYGHDVFQDLKKLKFDQYKEQYKNDTRELLFNEAEHFMKEGEKNNAKMVFIQMPKRYKNLIYDCLNADDGRIDMRLWTGKWDDCKDEIQDEAKHGVISA